MSKDSIININGKLMYGRIVLNSNGDKKLLDPLNYVSKLSQEHGILKVTQNQFKNFNDVVVHVKFINSEKYFIFFEIAFPRGQERLQVV